MVEVGKRVRELRKSHKITQNEFAQRLGVTKSTISAYENGSRLPSYDILLRISLIFKVSTDYLLGRSDKKFQAVDISGLTEKQIEFVHSSINAFRAFNILKSQLSDVEQKLLDEFIETGIWRKESVKFKK